MAKAPAVLFTGSSGFIGTVVVQELLQSGCNVSGSDAEWFSTKTGSRDFVDLDADLLSGIDVVIHLAGLADDKLCNAFPDQARQLNVAATEKLAKSCKEAGVQRFILASSSAVYGNTEGVASEDHPTDPATIYSQGKLQAENLLSELRDSDFEVVCLRFGSGYGLSPKPREDLVLNKMAILALQNGEIGLSTDGDCYRPFVHVNDMAAALVFSATQLVLTEDHYVFNVSHPDGNITVGDAVETLSRLTGCKMLKPVDKVDPRSYQIDPARLIDCGFQYQWPLEKGLDLLIRQIRHQGTLSLEPDRVETLGSVFQNSTVQPSSVHASTIKGQPAMVGSVTPSHLSGSAHTGYLSDVDSIISNSSYRMTGAHSCAAADLLASEYQVGTDHRVLMFRSGTDALTRALQVSGIGVGDCVAVPDQCFHAVASAVLSLGATPVLVDTRTDDFNLDARQLQAAISSREIDAVIAVDNYGTPCDWKAIGKVTRQHNIPFIVDACESLGSSRTNQSVIDHADIVVLSFSFTKPIHAAGMGGALIADKAITTEIESREEWLFRQLRLPEINAAYLVRAWDKLHANIDYLREIYARYSEVTGQYGFTAQKEYGISTRIHAPFLVPSDSTLGCRDATIAALKSKGVSAGDQFACQSSLLSIPSECRVSRDVASRVITLPTGGGLERDHMQLVTDVFTQVAESFSKEHKKTCAMA